LVTVRQNFQAPGDFDNVVLLSDSVIPDMHRFSRPPNSLGSDGVFEFGKLRVAFGGPTVSPGLAESAQSAPLAAPAMVSCERTSQRRSAAQRQITYHLIRMLALLFRASLDPVTCTM